MTQKTVHIGEKDLVGGFFQLVGNNIHVVNIPPCGEADQRTRTIRLKDRSVQVNNEIIRIETLIFQNNFLPFENSRLEYQKILRPLRIEAEHLEMAIAGYPYWMNPGFLQLTRENSNLPLFIVLDIYSDQGFSIVANVDWEGKHRVQFTPDLPTVIKNQYARTAEILFLYGQNRRNSDTSIQTEYSGVMPDEYRETIRKAEASGLFRQIFVVAEAPEWKVNKVVHANTDPLIIGITNNQNLYFLGQYDPTDMELVAAEKFSNLTE